MPNIAKYFWLILLLALTGVGLYFSSYRRAKAPESIRTYHETQYFRYAQYVENSVSEARNELKIDLDSVLGGIVPHHIPTTIPLLAQFYSALKNTRDVRTFIILAPDHVDAGRGNISASKANFVMPFATLRPDLSLIEKLEKTGFVAVSEPPFDREHSIDSQLLLISKLFPDAKIVPLIFRSSMTKDAAKAFGSTLAGITDEGAFVVASVDFTHYLSEKQARPADHLSAEILGAMGLESTSLLEADSSQALAAMMSYLATKGANSRTNLGVFNTRDFNANNDYTTGYVTGFWGIKNALSGPLKNNEPVTILFVGDIMLSRLIGGIMAQKNDWKYPFLKIADFLKNADLTVGNLEGPISSRGVRSGSIYSFRADPRAVEGLKYAGFDILSVANNHIWDYGADAVSDTIEIVRQAGIDIIGGGANYEKAHAPIIKNIKGVKIAFLAYTKLISPTLGRDTAEPAIAFLDSDQVISDIKYAKRQSDIVVVSLHWGNEYETRHNSNQEKIAHALIDAGANLIIGHHPHVVQEVEEYGGGFIAYSLGNFVFDQNFSAATRKGLMLRVTVTDKKLTRVEEIEIGFNESFQPIMISE